MVRRADGAEGWLALIADKRRNAVVLGPAAGVGEETAAKVLAALVAGRAAVVDADGLTSFAEKPGLSVRRAEGRPGALRADAS